MFMKEMKKNIIIERMVSGEMDKEFISKGMEEKENVRMKRIEDEKMIVEMKRKKRMEVYERMKI